KPLVLPWGRTPRLDSGVRVSQILDFPDISLVSVSGPKWALCLARVRKMDLFSFIRTADPTKVRIGERQRAEGEPKLLDTTVGRVVPLLPVAPDRTEGELEASVDKLFDEGGSGNQTEKGDYVVGGQGADIQLVSEDVDTVVEDAAPLQPRRQRKRKTVVVDAGEPSHPAKKLREDHGTPNGASIAGKFMSAVQRLLVGVVLNDEVRGEPIPTLPFVTSSVSATPEHEDGGMLTPWLELTSKPLVLLKVDSLVRSSAPMVATATIVTSMVDPSTIAKKKPVEPSVFGVGSSSTGGSDHTMGGFTDLTSSDFIFSSIRTVISPDTDLQKMSLSAEVRMRAEYNIKEKKRLKSVVDEQTELLKVREKEIENLKAQLLLKEAEAAKVIRLRAEASKLEAVDKSLQDEVHYLKEHNATLEKEKSELDVKVADLAALVEVREQEVADLDALVTSVKSQNDNLVGQVHGLETSSVRLQEKVTVYENCMGQLERFQDERMKVVNDKFDKLYADFIEMALHLEEKFYPHLLTTIAGRRWLLTHGMKLAIAKCLNSPEYLSALGEAIEKGMQDGLAAGITHGQEGRVLTDVVAYNPSAEVDYVFALQQLPNVNFLLAELKSNKDASVETLMNILYLEEVLAERLGSNESQPHVDQLMVPIHHSPDQTVIGATAISLALDVSSSRARKIKDNIANHRSALCDVFILLDKPFSTAVLMGAEGASDTVPSIVGATTSLSITFASASLIAPISTDDYDIVRADGQEGAGTDGQTVTDGNADPFPNVDDAELSIQ
ncbi:hypothetical protein Tco_0855739, partial [Tanacetum coccineum]